MEWKCAAVEMSTSIGVREVAVVDVDALGVAVFVVAGVDVEAEVSLNVDLNFSRISACSTSL